MSTYTIESRKFNVKSDGWDKETIRDCVRKTESELRGAGGKRKRHPGCHRQSQLLIVAG